MFHKFLSILLVVVYIQVQAQNGELSKIRISFMGDVMQHGPQIRSAYNPVDDNYNYFPCFQHVAPSIREADLAIANLELTLAGKPFSGYPTFSAPDELALALKNSGIDVLVTANNHSLDKRKKGLERTLHMLDSFDIPHTGTFLDQNERDQRYPLIIAKEGIKIALLNYTYGTNGIPVTEPNIVNLIDTTQIRLDLEKAREEQADVIIVFTHWGLEYQNLPDKEQKQITRFCENHGADMVIGSHPHVLQPIEWEDDFLVVYSLGNFISNQRDRYKDGGMIFSVELAVDTIAHSCQILEAGYQLVWVYKRPAGNISEYFLLPAAQQGSRDLITSTEDLEKMELFLADSRTLLSKHNKGNIKEYRYLINHLPHYNYKGKLVDPVSTRETIKANPKTDVMKKIEMDNSTGQHEDASSELNQNEGKPVFRIQFLASNKAIDLNRFDKKYFDQVYTEEVKGFIRYLTGNFQTKEEAEDFLMIIINETKYKDAFVVEKKTK